MKKLKDQLKTIQKSLVSLSKQVEKVSKQVEKVESAKAAKKAAPKKKVAKKKVAKKKAAKKAVKKTVKKAAAPKKKAAAKSPAKKADAAGKATVLDTVFDVVKKSRGGATISKLKEKTGLDSRQLSNALYKLTKRGKIEAKSRGLYIKK